MELLGGISVCLSIVRRNFDTASSVMFLLRLGKLLRKWTRRKSMENLARSISLNIGRVWMGTENGEELVPLHQVQAGDQVVIRMGGMIPLDGTIAEGEVMPNQASLIGESIPVPRQPGGSVCAGAVVGEGECILTVAQQSGKNRYNKIVVMVKESGQPKSTAENHAARLADQLTPYTLTGNVLVYLLTRNVTHALSVLMVDFSCALRLSIPLAVLSVVSEISRFHMTMKGGEYLETVAQVDTVVFDKTGTLTHASPVMAQVVLFGGNREPEVLRLAACPEKRSPHSMANAMVQAIREQDLAHEEIHSQVGYLVAHGIVSTADGKRVTIGSTYFVLGNEGYTVPPGEQATFDTLPKQCSHLHLAVNGVLTAVICISDPLRTEAVDTVATLRGLGAGEIVILTGDSERTATAITTQVEVDEHRAEMLPEDRAHFVQAERSRGRTVVMIGNGVSDPPALSAVNASIAISDGAVTAREIADITITASDLFELVQLRRLFTVLMNHAQSNYRFVIGFSGGLIALSASGVLAPATSTTLHNLSILGTSLRSMTGLLPPTKT